MPRVALGVQYDGRPFFGWQSQKDGNTVQDHLQTAVSRFAQIPVTVQCAGRTDTGVHALGQVVHLDVPFHRENAAWVRGVNTYLPKSIAVQWAQEVASEFHARFDAYRRTYHYLIYNAPVRSPLWDGRVGWYHRPLDADAMHHAAQALVGEHDFSAFRAAQCQANSPIKTLYDISVTRQGAMVLVCISANAFLHHMVRNIVGSLIFVGTGREPITWLNELLTHKNRHQSAPTFAPDGLYLTAIDYPEHFALPNTHRDFACALGLMADDKNNFS